MLQEFVVSVRRGSRKNSGCMYCVSIWGNQKLPSEHDGNCLEFARDCNGFFKGKEHAYLPCGRAMVCINTSPDSRGSWNWC